MIDLAALTSLRAVDTCGSVVGAADSLGFTPSAVSQQVKRLEKQTGVALLERVGRGVMLTAHGRRLVDDGARLLTELEEIESGLQRDAARVTGRLRVAAFSTAMRGLVAGAVRDLLDQHPELSLTLTEREPWDTVDLVAAGQQDLGIVHQWGDVPLHLPDHLVSVTIARDVADVVVPRGHRLAGRTRVSPRDLVDEPWVATPEGSICRQWLLRMYDGTGRAPRIAHVAMEFDSHLALVGAGLGIALVPRLGRSALPPDVVAVAAHRPVPSREITVVHRASMAESPAVRAVVEALRTN
ncbi:DNA-binding transcriptional LysR family regulator [Nocardioides cavernae]|uniref:DNA-binding transcriptional LysR family regulator n=1 Tax=Nocardioides cavernae TaxID=1921566 RepID=A0A7Y9H2Q9_9ACTN|nr:LysR family transcriptional regulator [Nocardioides cavernae]NYE36750.1 DNA-binding transcriptional LysR family regulator [Nocardioides cavernae]